MIGMSRRRQTSNSLRVCASMPLAASITITARVGGGERAVGVFRKILVARRVEQIEHRALIFERHHRGGDGDAALLLDLHPVRTRAACGPARLHLPRETDGAAQQQQMLRQRGLARVGMRDDGKGAPARGFGGRGLCINHKLAGLAGGCSQYNFSSPARIACCVRDPREGDQVVRSGGVYPPGFPSPLASLKN